MVCQVTARYNEKFWMEHPKFMKAQILFVAVFCARFIPDATE